MFLVISTCPRVYLHYHDYILDGRWVVTENIDSDDKSAVVRNKGDGWDDEECPEKETYQWELRSKRSGTAFSRLIISTSPSRLFHPHGWLPCTERIYYMYYIMLLQFRNCFPFKMPAGSRIPRWNWRNTSRSKTSSALPSCWRRREELSNFKSNLSFFYRINKQ